MDTELELLDESTEIQKLVKLESLNIQFEKTLENDKIHVLFQQRPNGLVARKQQTNWSVACKKPTSWLAVWKTILPGKHLCVDRRA